MEFDLNEWKSLLNIKNPRHQQLFTNFDHPNQKLIRLDVLRTKTGQLSDDDMYNLQLMITLYCKESNISYKQGLNELFVSFFLLTRQNIPLITAYELGQKFIDTCIASMFKDDDFRLAQAMFSIINLLLKYHSPFISNTLKKACTTPELYAASWFITLFSAKLPNTDLIFTLWKEFLIEKDPIFPCYLAVALLQRNQETILSKSFMSPAQPISRILVSNLEEVKQWISQARSIKSSTPYSWIRYMKNNDILNLQTINSAIQKLAEDQALCVWPEELLQNLYQSIQCCKNRTCEWCVNKRPGIKFQIIDCRTEAELKNGRFLGSETVESSYWRDVSLISDFVSRLQQFKGGTHLVLLGWSGENLKNVQRMSEEIMTPSEMVVALLEELSKQEYPYVSIATGGFKAFHDFALIAKAEILSHNKLKCLACSQDKPQGKLQGLAKSVSDGFKSTISKLNFKSILSNTESELIPTEVLESKYYLCRKFDKVTNDKSDDELSLHIMKDEILLAKFAHNQPRSVVKTIEHFPMKDLLKITSMKKFPNVLTFCTTSKQICLIFSEIKVSKDCISLVTKQFRDLKTSS